MLEIPIELRLLGSQDDLIAAAKELRNRIYIHQGRCKLKESWAAGQFVGSIITPGDYANHAYTAMDAVIESLEDGLAAMKD